MAPLAAEDRSGFSSPIINDISGKFSNVPIEKTPSEPVFADGTIGKINGAVGANSAICGAIVPRVPCHWSH